MRKKTPNQTADERDTANGYHWDMVLLAVMLGVGLVWNLILAYLMALSLLRPPRMTDGRAVLWLHRVSPADLGLAYEEKSYLVHDECTGRRMKIAGWWIPNPNAQGKCAVIVHGYSDAKIGGIAWAPMLHAMGFAILAIDLRAHGESDGKYSTGGFWERHDLDQVLAQLRAEKEIAQLILMGISLGAAVCAAAAAERDDIDAIILESPFADYYRASTHLAENMGAPRWIFRRLSMPIAQWLARADFAEVAPVKMIPKLTIPLMLIQSGLDPFVSPADIAELNDSLAKRPTGSITVRWLLEGVHHVVGLKQDPELYRQRIADFLALTRPAASKV